MKDLLEVLYTVKKWPVLEANTLTIECYKYIQEKDQTTTKLERSD